MSYERHRPWISRTACGLVYLLALTPTLTVMAVDADEAPPAPPAGVDPAPPPPPILAPPPVAPTPVPVTPPPPGAAVNGATTAPLFDANERNVLLLGFETDESVQGVPGEVISTLPARIASVLNRTYDMDAAVFNRTSPIVQRALRERRLTEAQVTGNVPEAAYPAVAREYGVNTVVTGTVSSYNYDRATNAVELGLTLDVRALGPGGRTQVIAVSGRTAPVGVVSSEIALAAEAANDAATRAAAEIARIYGLQPVPERPAEAPKRARKNRTGAIAAVGAVLLLVAIIAGNKGGNRNVDTTTPPPANGGGGGDNTTPPPPPF
ncbi:MAG: hypothetical protein KY468_09535 [Armatimonadetes bacterium]|nr:hypothetical protein [Armatimonadota bacterium]